MALTALSTGLLWPHDVRMVGIAPSAITLDADAEKVAMVGRVFWEGRPGTAKTIDTTGSSAISWQGGGTAVYDNGASTLDVGIQGVGTTGPTAIPDGSYSVKAVVTTAADATPTLTTTNSWHTIVPTTGTVSLTHGDLIAVVWDMTNQAGADTIAVVTAATGLAILPVVNAFAAAAWGATGVGNLPCVMLTASDGTRGTLDGSVPFGLAASLTWDDATNPDEYGMIFRVPFDCKVDALWCAMRTENNASDFTITLSASAESTRQTLASVTVDGAQLGPVASEKFSIFNLATEISLTANTDYCVSVDATSTGDLRFQRFTLGHADARKFLPGGTTMRSVTSQAGADFTGSSTTLMHMMGVRISQVQDGASAGGGVPGSINGGMQ